jgi:malate dehydrogenase (quinone)
VGSSDNSIIGLLGASPGASTATYIAVNVLERCFATEMADAGWRERLQRVIPSYGIDLAQDADAVRDVRARTAKVLQIEENAAVRGPRSG